MGLFDNLKNNAANMMLNSDMALGFVNSQVQRYATVKGIRLNGKSIECTATPNGSQETFTVTASEFSIADDNSSLSIGKLSADMPWVENALQDFAQGKEFPIPEGSRSIIGKIKVFL